MRLILLLAILSCTCAFAQQGSSNPQASESGLPDAPPAQQTAPGQQTPDPAKVPELSGNTKRSNAIKPNGELIPPSQQQPKRILGIMPNYRAVSAGALPPPPTARESFKTATENSFDYSAFVFVGLTSLIAKGEDAHPTLGKGVGGLWAYTWRGFVDKTDGNYLVLFALPTLLHEDERYYAMGSGNPWRRVWYSSTRVFITPSYSGHNTFNAAELFGRAAAEGVSAAYYPAADQTAGAMATKWGYAVMRDSLTNTFREFWPDIAVHVLHRHP